MKVYEITNIKWDTDGDDEILEDLPDRVIVAVEGGTDEYEDDVISDALSDEYGYCHKGFTMDVYSGPEEPDIVIE